MDTIKAACRIYENEKGGITIYLKREIATHIKESFTVKTDYLAEFDGKTIKIGEL